MLVIAYLPTYLPTLAFFSFVMKTNEVYTHTYIALLLKLGLGLRCDRPGRPRAGVMFCFTGETVHFEVYYFLHNK